MQEISFLIFLTSCFNFMTSCSVLSVVIGGLLAMQLQEQNRTEQNRTGQNRTGQNRTEQNRTGQDRTEQEVRNL
jgi:Na+/glutamate symporter